MNRSVVLCRVQHPPLLKPMHITGGVRGRSFSCRCQSTYSKDSNNLETAYKVLAVSHSLQKHGALKGWKAIHISRITKAKRASSLVCFHNDGIKYNKSQLIVGFPSKSLGLHFLQQIQVANALEANAFHVTVAGNIKHL